MSKAVSDKANRVIGRVEEITSGGTGERYAGALRVFSRWASENDIDPLQADAYELDRYFRHLKERGYVYSTVGVHQAALTKFFEAARYLSDNNRLDTEVPAENPTEGTNLFEVYPDSAERKSLKSRTLAGTDSRHALEPSEVERMVENVPAPTVRNQLLIRLCYQCMLRRGELIHLKVGDIDRESREVTVRAEVSKNSENRTAYYTPALDPLMAAWIDVDRESYALADDSQYVFVSPQGEHISGWRASVVVRKAAENTGLQGTLYTDAQGKDRAKVGVHTLRHSGAVRRWRGDCDVKTLQELLGHEDISTTQQYLDVRGKDVAEKARRSW